MGGNDDDNRNDFDRLMSDVGKDLANTKKELERVMDELRGQLPNPHDALEDLRKQRDSDDAFRRGTFERFKGFVDSNFALLSDGFKNFPANVRELKQRMQEEREARRVEEIDIWERWTGSDDSPDHIKMQVERASKEEKQSVTDATFLLLRESWERNKHVPAQKILDLYRDDEWGFGSLDQFATPMLSFGGACYYKSETVENLPSTARWGWPAATQKWLSVEWFKRSSYSPIRLEAHPDLAEKGEKWRAAFEDLLLVSLDKPMQTTERVGQRLPYGKPQSTYHGPGLDWMLSLQCRGILPPQLPSFYGLYRPVDRGLWFGNDPCTMLYELDAITKQQQHGIGVVNMDINALMDEVGIQAQPEMDAYPQSCQARIPQSPWQVPDTEAELYEQMQPSLPDEEEDLAFTGSKEEDAETMSKFFGSSVIDRDFLTGLNAIGNYERLHGKSDTFLDDLIALMDPEDIDEVWDKLVSLDKTGNVVRRFEERVELHERWKEAFERAEVLGVEVEDWRASGLPLETVEARLEERESEELEEFRRVDSALTRAEKLGYDFEEWDWFALPLEELEAELEREEAYTAARRRGVLAKAARLGYDFDGWEYEGLPVQELEDEMLRMEEYAKRDAPLHQVRQGVAEEGIKRPEILSQLTTTETTRLPDGTVTTKVVLKRRFADGREEVKESVSTVNERWEARAEEERERAREEVERKGEKEKEKARGWFWS